MAIIQGHLIGLCGSITCELDPMRNRIKASCFILTNKIGADGRRITSAGLLAQFSAASTSGSVSLRHTFAILHAGAGARCRPAFFGLPCEPSINTHT